MEFTNASNYEHIRFEETTFPFNCFFIKNSNTLPHWHNHFELVSAQNGNCTVYVNGCSFSVSEKQLVLIPPGSLHSIFPNGSCDYYAIVAGESLFEGLRTDSHISDVFSPFMSIGMYEPILLSVQNNAYTKCFDLVYEIRRESTQKNKGYQARIKSLLILLFSLVHDILPENFFENNKISDSTHLIKSSLDYLNLHYSEHITISHMSKYCHLSIQHFSRLFKGYTGKTFVEYLTLFRLEQARKILMGTDIPIIQIPDLVGFCNGNYFSRLYKKYYGHPPSRDRLR